MIFCSVISVGCRNGELRKKMISFMSHKVLLPEELVEVKNGYINSSKNILEFPAFVLFYGKDECTSCAMNHLKEELPKFENIEQNSKCKVLILFSPSEDEMLDVQEQIRMLKIQFPIYIDLYGDFYRINTDFPSDRRFHSFLLDKDGYPVFVGNPLYSEKLSVLFEKVLKKVN